MAKREGQDADGHVPPVALVPFTDDNLLDDRRRIAADARYAHLGRRQGDGLLSGRERTGHGSGDYNEAVSEWLAVTD